MWINQIQQAMGLGACGEVDCLNGRCTVKVRWDESRLGGNEGSTDSSITQHELTLESIL